MFGMASVNVEVLICTLLLDYLKVTIICRFKAPFA